MKRFFFALSAFLMMFIFSFGASAEIIIDEDWIEDKVFDYLISGNSHTSSASPNYSNTNNSSLSFFITNTGKASVMYTIFLKPSNTSGATVQLHMERHLIGPFWQRLNTEWTDKFTEKYHVQSFSINVNESGLYRVVMSVTAGNDKFKSIAEFEYEKGVLRGDVNSDGRITAADARLALRYTSKLESFSSSQKKKGDMNGDDSVTAADARLILKFSAMLV